MFYAICGFILGVIIPYMARRFAKFMPATMAVAVWRLLYPLKNVNRHKKSLNAKYAELYKSYIWRSVMYGIVLSCLFVFASINFADNGLCGILFFIWALLLLMEIDYKTFLLPDIITVPLLIGGFAFAVFNGGFVTPVESVNGALVGYLLPVLASILLVWKHPDAFGGGDIKLLSAVGAWVGGINVVYVILVACMLFAFYSIIKRRRVGAFGPAIALSAIIVAFYCF